MKCMFMAIMAIAVAVTFSAPSFAGDKKEEKKPGKFVEMINADDMKKGEKKGKADETFAGDKKKEEKDK